MIEGAIEDGKFKEVLDCVLSFSRRSTAGEGWFGRF